MDEHVGLFAAGLSAINHLALFFGYESIFISLSDTYSKSFSRDQ